MFLLRAAFVTSSFCGALPPVEILAVCFVLAILSNGKIWQTQQVSPKVYCDRYAVRNYVTKRTLLFYFGDPLANRLSDWH
jgi:hypothetical protein